MANSNVYLVSKYFETKSEISLFGVADCRFRADRLVADEIQYAPMGTIVKNEEDQTFVSDHKGNLLITYTITEIPLNERIDISDF